MHFTTATLYILYFTHYNTIQAFNFTPGEEKAGLIFKNIGRARISYDSYTVVYHLDIGGYLDITQTIADNINRMWNLCRLSNDIDCDLTMENIKNHVEYMRADEYDINAYRVSEKPKRSKRAIEFIGKIFHWAIGLVDAETARGYCDKINELQNTTERIHQDQQKQLALVRESLELNSQSFANLKRYINETTIRMGEFFGIIQEKIKSLHHAQKFNEIVNVVTLMIIEHGRLSKQILRLLEETIQGKISQLIQPTELKRDLTIIRNKLHEQQMLPIDLDHETALHAFKFASARAALYENRVLIEFTLPVIERDKFTIHEIIAVPLIIDQKIMLIDQSFVMFLLNEAATQYIPLRRDELSRAKINNVGEYIISPELDTHFVRDDSCEMNIMLNPFRKYIEKTCSIRIIPTTTYFTTISPNDLYYVCTNEPIKIQEHCNGKSMSVHILKESGTLKLESNCRVNTNKLSLRTKTNYRMENFEIFEITNHAKNLTMSIFKEKAGDTISLPPLLDAEPILIQDQERDYDKLIEMGNRMAHEQKYKFDFERMKYDTSWKVGWATILMFILAVIVAGAFALCVYKKVFNLGNWMIFLKKFGDESGTIPKVFVRNIYPRTPRNQRRTRTEDIELKDFA